MMTDQQSVKISNFIGLFDNDLNDEFINKLMTISK